jgi:Asp-tRNA(Asn)/Glu-tRNA(Gln) amidotransferase A subunit family amidase
MISARAGSWSCCAAPSTTPSAISTWWCCPRAAVRRARSTPALKREEADKPRNPELENTGQFNVYGIPAISVPCGFTASGLPVGLMIAGPRFSEGRVLALAHAYERATDWHTRRPPLEPGTPVPPLAATDEDK